MDDKAEGPGNVKNLAKYFNSIGEEKPKSQSEKKTGETGKKATVKRDDTIKKLQQNTEIERRLSDCKNQSDTSATKTDTSEFFEKSKFVSYSNSIRVDSVAEDSQTRFRKFSIDILKRKKSGNGMTSPESAQTPTNPTNPTLNGETSDHSDDLTYRFTENPEIVLDDAPPKAYKISSSTFYGAELARLSLSFLGSNDNQVPEPPRSLFCCVQK